MAKRQRLKRQPSEFSRNAANDNAQQHRRGSHRSLASESLRQSQSKKAVDAQPRGLANGKELWAPLFTQKLELATTFGLGGLLVYLAYHPSDSVLVEQGDAIRFCFLVFLLLVVDGIGRRLSAPGSQANFGGTIQQGSSSDADVQVVVRPDSAANGSMANALRALLSANTLCSLLPWGLAGWMMLSAFATSPPGNLRASTNEAWLWFAAAAIFHLARRHLNTLASRQNLVVILLMISCGLAVHGLHQYGYSLPKNRAEYRENPDAVLAMAGIEAPAGSAERMIFENRLMDGGPSATFALANTLAGYLLAASVISVTVLLTSWNALGRSQQIKFTSLAVLLASGLFATRSRTAIIALLLSTAVIVVARSRFIRRRARSLWIGLVSLASATVLGLGYLSVFGNREWFEQAPTSLAFRFQYWRSTWRLVADSPWFGAGPGNFQALYERYREASASEQIAEPHNLMMETLAAGGVPALAFLVSLSIAVVFQQRHNGQLASSLENEDSASSERNIHPPRRSRMLYLGAGVGLLLVWIIGLLSLQLPDVVASLFALPICLMFGPSLHHASRKISSRDLDLSLGIATAALLVHLSMSGGWTVPGLAIWLWIIAGSFARPSWKTETSHTTLGTVPVELTVGRHLYRRLADLRMMGPFAILLVFWWITLNPTITKDKWIASIASGQQLGNDEKIERSIRNAASSDTWAPEAAIWLADFYRWKLIQQMDRQDIDSIDDLHRLWTQAIQEVRNRVGQDAGVDRVIGIQAIHLYQRWGEQRDLEIAHFAFQRALETSPTDQWLLAQLSVIERAMGNTKEAQALALKAIEFSQLGNNIERSIDRQIIYVAKILGIQASETPIRTAATTLIN